MNVSVKVEGREALRQRLTQIVQNTKTLVSQQVRYATRETSKMAQAGCPVAFGRLRDSIREQYSNEYLRGDVIVGRKYGQWVEGIHWKGKYGRAPGKWPPVEPILRWVRKKRIHIAWFGKATTKAAMRAAFLVRRKIGKKGTPAQPFLGPAFYHYAEKFTAACKEILARAAQLAHIEMRRGA
jgi:hypothetical protein